MLPKLREPVLWALSHDELQLELAACRSALMYLEVQADENPETDYTADIEYVTKRLRDAEELERARATQGA